MVIQCCFNLFTNLSILVALQIFRLLQRITSIKADEADISPSDFTIMVRKVRNVGNEIDYDDEIKKLFENCLGKERECTVKKVNLAFDLCEWNELKKKKSKLLQQKKIAVTE